MDNIQNTVDDFVESPTEKASKLATYLTQQIIKEKYPKGYSREIYNSIYNQQLKIARQQLLDQMKFEQEYKRQRHIGDIDEAERSMDRLNHNIEEGHLLRQTTLHTRLYDSESRLLTDDIDGININKIVDNYGDLAQHYNTSDQNKVYHIIEEGLKNPSLLFDSNGITLSKEDNEKLKGIIYNSINTNGEISLSDIQGLLPNEKKDQIVQLLQNGNGKVNIKDLLAQLVEMRIKTSKEYMSVASEDNKVRTEGVDMKLSSINNVRHTGITSENYYENHIDKMQKRKETLEQESKKHFYEERDKQRQLDVSVRGQQVNAMQQANLNTQEKQQMISEATQDNSIGGMSR